MTPPSEAAYVYRATGTRVVDGDTFVAEVDLGFRVSYSCVVRLNGVNTPEKGRAGSRTAGIFLEGLVLNRRLLLASHKDERSFERWICDVWNVEGPDPVNLADALIAAHMGVAFHKGEKWER